MNKTTLLSGNEVLDVFSALKTAAAIFTTEKLYIEVATDAMLALWGKDRSVLGLSLIDVIPQWKIQGFIAELRLALKTGQPLIGKSIPMEVYVEGQLQTKHCDYEFRPFRKPDGTVYCLLNIIINVTGSTQGTKNKELVVANEEISAINEVLNTNQQSLHELNNELEERIAQRTRAAEAAKYRLEAMVMNTPIAMTILKGEELIVEVVNQPMLKVWRRQLEQVVGRGLVEIFPELEDQPNPARMRGVLKSGKRFFLPETEVTLGTVDGELKQHYARFSYDPIFEPDGTLGSILVTVIDITEEVLNRKQLEQSRIKLQKSSEEHAALNEELIAINEELQSTNEELSKTQRLLEQNIDGLAESEGRFRNLVREATLGIIMLSGTDIKVGIVNEAFGQLIGRTATELEGRPLFDIIPEAETVFRPIIDQVRETGQSIYLYDQPYLVNTEKGVITGFLNLIYQPYREANGAITGVIVLCQEISEQLKIRRLLEASEEHFRQLADIVPAKISNALATGEVTFFNQKWLDYAGMNFEDLRDFGYYQMMHPDEIPIFQQQLGEAAAKGVALESELRFKDINGQYRWHLNIASPILNEDGEITMWVGSTTDIQRIKEEEQRKHDFIGMVSHELKTPLTSLNAYLQLLQSKISKSTDHFAQRSLDQSLKQVKKMTSMINGFLNVSRLEAGKIDINKTIFDVQELFAETEEETIPMITSHQIVFNCPSQTSVSGDRDKLGQVLNNLVSNAVKYSKTGSTIHVDCTSDPEYITIAVSDNGFGIQADDLKQVFDRYYRVENHSQITGFGIGLYLCAEIIKLHDGKIWAESEIGKGSIFYFSLPLIK